MDNPRLFDQSCQANVDSYDGHYTTSVTLRDLFAGLIAAHMVTPGLDINLPYDIAAMRSYALADALLRERSKL